MARGEDTEPFYPGIAEPHFEERESLDWAVDSLESLAFTFNTLLGRLCARLQTHGKATDSIRLKLQSDPPQATILEVFLQAEPTRARTPQHHLFQPKAASNPEMLPRTLARLQALAACRTWGYPAAWEGAGSSDSEPRWDQSGVLGQDGETEHRVEGAPGVGLALQGRLSLLKAH